MKRHVLISQLIVLLMIASTYVPMHADMLEVRQRIQDSHPQARFFGSQFYESAGFFEDFGSTSVIWGTSFSTGSTPTESAWNHVNEIRDLLGNDIGNLVPKVQADGEMTIGLMYDHDTDSYKFSTLRFDQYFENIPVFRSGIGFIVRNDQQNSLVMSSVNISELDGFQANVGTEAKVTPAMAAAVEKFLNRQKAIKSVVTDKARIENEIVTSQQRLVVFAGTNGQATQPTLAVEFVATQGTAANYPDYHKHRVVASVATGEILYSESLVHQVDVAGSVTGLETDGLGVWQCHGTSATPLPYAEVEIDGGNLAFTDANGDFVIPHTGSGPVTVTSRLRGEFFTLEDQSMGGSTPELSQTITPPGPVDFLHNPSSGEFSTANVNGYVGANLIRDYALFFAPNFPTVGTEKGFRVVVNLNQACAGFYNGVAINMSRGNEPCDNTAMASVIYHEYGHHLIGVSGNGQGQFGEGAADAFAVLIQDDPVLAFGLLGDCSMGIRDARNFRSYPCSGGVHDCGQLLSGCVWDLRNELIITEPNDYREIGSSLFVNMMIARGQQNPGNQMISPEITAIYQTLDDGAHCTAIETAFGAHNMGTGMSCSDSNVFPPATTTVFRGIQIGGELGDLSGSDDVSVMFNPGFTLNNLEAPVWLIFDATSPIAGPQTLELALESQAGTPGLTVTTEAFNWTTAEYDVVVETSESFNVDSIKIAELTANIGDFVEAGTNNVRTRSGWRKTGFTINFPWEVRIDQFVWTVGS